MMTLARRIVDNLNLSAPRWAFVPLRDFYIAIALICVASSALAIAQSLFGYWPFPVFAKDHASGLFYNSVHAGLTFAIVILALIIYQLYWFIPALLPGLYLAHSRGAWLALVLGLISIRFRYPILLLILVLALGVVYTISPNASDLERIQIWHAAWMHLTFWGNGPGSFKHLYIGDPAVNLVHPQYAHNEYLQAMFEFGIWSVVPFAVIAFAVSKTHAQDWPILITFLFMACFSMPLYMPLVASIGVISLITVLTTQSC